jgi:glyoxylase-like metal-dependent hydrolase (beta-lactamase superfamily II)
MASSLPSDIVVLERGWLSSNNILLLGPADTAVVDSGYGTHSEQTVALVRSQLGQRPLDWLVNTHLHSDHCGGNAALQSAYRGLQTLIPPGHAEQVRLWDEVALTYAPTGQYCPRFQFDALLEPGTELRLGARVWQIHAAPGHDPHSVILFEPTLRVLISADTLWENGFGVVFPELEGREAFNEVALTLDLIESLRPRTVIPGHGAVFEDVTGALHRARQRLEKFVADPARHAMYAAKVLFKFRLLELQRVDVNELNRWAEQSSYLSSLHQTHAPEIEFVAWTDSLMQDLVRSGAARIEGTTLINQ